MAIQRVMMTDSRKEDVFYEEAIKTLRTNMQFSGVETKSIVITSCYPNEGKSDVAFQLAVEIGKMGKRVLIIDADIRKSSYIKRYQIKQKTSGLSQYLSGQVALEEVIYSTNYRNLEIIFSGPYAPNPSELLEQGRFSRLIEETRKAYDYVLIDTPPIINMSDAAIVAKQCDGAILVIESEAVSRRDAMKAKEQLTKSGCKLLGAVLNKVDMKKEKYYSSIIHTTTVKANRNSRICSGEYPLHIPFYREKTNKTVKMNKIRCFVMQSDRRLSGEKGVRGECTGRTVIVG